MAGFNGVQLPTPPMFTWPCPTQASSRSHRRLAPKPIRKPGAACLRLAWKKVSEFGFLLLPCVVRGSVAVQRNRRRSPPFQVAFSGSVDGHLRAYSAKDGAIVWDFDTVAEYKTVNGVPGRGGSLDGPGPAISGGMIFVNSGYAIWGGMPGNVLLAFSVDGR